MESSEAVETDVRKRVDKMNRYHAEMISCRVVVEAPLQHHRKGQVKAMRKRSKAE